MYHQLGADGPLTYLGVTGARRIADSTIAVGIGQVTYHVQGVRSTAAGAWGSYSVNYGTAAQATAETLKIAA